MPSKLRAFRCFRCSLYFIVLLQLLWSWNVYLYYDERIFSSHLAHTLSALHCESGDLLHRRVGGTCAVHMNAMMIMPSDSRTIHLFDQEECNHFSQANWCRWCPIRKTT